MARTPRRRSTTGLAGWCQFRISRHVWSTPRCWTPFPPQEGHGCLCNTYLRSTREAYDVHVSNTPQEGHGFFCAASDLKLEGTTRQEEAEAAALAALFEVAGELAGQGPTILFIKVR